MAPNGPKQRDTRNRRVAHGLGHAMKLAEARTRLAAIYQGDYLSASLRRETIQSDAPPSPRGPFRIPLAALAEKPLQMRDDNAEADKEADEDANEEVADAESEAEGDAQVVDAGDDLQFTYQPAKSGRPTNEHAAAARKCRGQVLNLIKTLAEEHGISPARVLDEVTSAFSGASSRARNPWNIYSKMATHPDWAGTEVRRIMPEFDPARHELPTLHAEHLSFMYKAFQKEHADDDRYLKILHEFETVHLLGSETTVAQRQRRVMNAAKKMERLMDGLRDTDKVEGMFLLCGSYVNDDAEVAHCYATLGLTEFPSVFKRDKDGPGLTSDDLLGMAKTFVYQHHLSELADDGLVVPTANNPSATRPSASRSARQAASVQAATLAASTSSAKPSVTRASSSRAFSYIPDILVRAEDGRLTRGQVDNDQVRTQLSGACTADMGKDVMHHGSLFLWKSCVARIQSEGYIVVGFPSDVRLPAESMDRKATSSWRKHDRLRLTMALEARETVGQGFRFEEMEQALKKSDIIIFTHDYTIACPDGPPDSRAVIRHWRTSGGKHLPCQDADGNMWMINYDLDRPNGRVISRLPHSGTKEPEEEPTPQGGVLSSTASHKGSVGQEQEGGDQGEGRGKRRAGAMFTGAVDAQPSPAAGCPAARRVAFDIDSDGEVDELFILTPSEYRASRSPSPSASTRTSAALPVPVRTAPSGSGGKRHQHPDATIAPQRNLHRAHNDDPPRAHSDETQTSVEKKRRQVSADDVAVKRARVEEQYAAVPTGGASRSLLASADRPAHRNAIPPLPASPAHAPSAMPPVLAAPASASAGTVDCAAVLRTLSPEVLAAVSALAHALQQTQQPPPPL
ncbi:hypothetical protein B0H12DRAFT_1123295 [Mycena haematopus]|nr:hypothetical protein B0H12DRAFT_1123295 [Mycena haematopus]